MLRPSHRRLAGLLASLALAASGCSREVPTSPAHAAQPASVFKDTLAADARNRRSAIAVFPVASSFIRRLPELGIMDGGGIDGDMQSTYFRTTATNREFRRGFAEFEIPRFPGRLLRATLILRETRASVSDPRPPDLHELSTYSDVDLDITQADFDRPTTPLATFETDANLENGTFRFDVTDLIALSRGARLGIRVKLAVDPNETGFIPLGTAFSRAATLPGVELDLFTTARNP
jgi:hypothetical protein